MSEEEKKKFIDRIKTDFYGTVIEVIDFDWLDSLPSRQELLLTNADEIRK